MPTENQGMDIHHPSTLVPPENFDLEPKISQGKSCLRCISTANVLGSKSTCPVSMVSQSSWDKAGSSLLMILMFIRGMKAMQGPKSIQNKLRDHHPMDDKRRMIGLFFQIRAHTPVANFVTHSRMFFLGYTVINVENSPFIKTQCSKCIA